MNLLITPIFATLGLDVNIETVVYRFVLFPSLDVMMQDLKKRKRLEKFGQGPAFLAHRASCEKKMQEKENAIEKQMTAAKAKLQEALQKAEDKSQMVADTILDSYVANVKVACEVVNAWMVAVDLGSNCVPKFLSEDIPPPGPDEVPELDWSQLPVPELLMESEKNLHLQLNSPHTSVKFVKDAKMLHTKQHFVWVRKCVMECSSVYVVEAMREAAKDHASCVEQVVRSLTKVASDLKSYMSQLARIEDREAAKKKKEAEKEEVAKATALAKQQANKVKKAAKGSNVPDIFLVAASDWAPIQERASLDVAMDDAAMDAPWILVGSPTVTTWKSSQLMALKLSEFAAGYKKAPSFKKDGRAQAAVMPKGGKEECQVMFKKMMEDRHLVDISSVSGGDNFMGNIWQWGLDSTLAGAWLSPNCAAQIKVVAMGSITIIAFELKELLSVIGAECTCDQITNFVLSLNKGSEHWSSVRGLGEGRLCCVHSPGLGCG